MRKIFIIFGHQQNANQTYTKILENVWAVTNTNLVQTIIEISVQVPQNSENSNTKWQS